ncbi:unnamed protein product [Paramecium sonneborni]|uniref:Uncharacterized protein n=1 Tax=Paramecium sonneborni TaxID=65129 RepID=A0A8S1QS31_9CILI|nr:unnamed protein product [Paramecium sonneborni]
MKLINLFSLYGLLFDMRISQNFINSQEITSTKFRSQKFVQDESNKSSTESESEGIQEIELLQLN